MSTNKNTKIASAILYCVVGVLSVMGCVYLFTPQIMPYHERFIGMQHEQLHPNVNALLLYMMKDMGASFLAIAFALFVLIRGPFKRGERWARWSILAISLIALLPLLYITLSIGLYTPWWLVGLGIILVITALLISKTA